MCCYKQHVIQLSWSDFLSTLQILGFIQYEMVPIVPICIFSTSAQKMFVLIDALVLCHLLLFPSPFINHLDNISLSLLVTGRYIEKVNMYGWPFVFYYIVSKFDMVRFNLTIYTFFLHSIQLLPYIRANFPVLPSTILKMASLSPHLCL